MSTHSRRYPLIYPPVYGVSERALHRLYIYVQGPSWFLFGFCEKKR